MTPFAAQLSPLQMRYWNLVVQETTTFTLPNPDEYERPEEIREVEVNRVKARSVAVEGDALNFGDKLRASLLGQLNEAIADWEDRDLRRSFVHMQVHDVLIFPVGEGRGGEGQRMFLPLCLLKVACIEIYGTECAAMSYPLTFVILLVLEACRFVSRVHLRLRTDPSTAPLGETS